MLHITLSLLVGVVCFCLSSTYSLFLSQAVISRLETSVRLKSFSTRFRLCLRGRKLVGKTCQPRCSSRRNVSDTNPIITKWQPGWQRVVAFYKQKQNKRGKAEEKYAEAIKISPAEGEFDSSPTRNEDILPQLSTRQRLQFVSMDFWKFSPEY